MLITLIIDPSLVTLLCTSQTRDILEERVIDLKAFFPKMLFPVALLPFPVRPTKTSVFSSLFVSNLSCNCRSKIT